ncbi:MAG: ankyrin repeat domain-containing protein, partial [Verrucomicrobiota bacterium]
IAEEGIPERKMWQFSWGGRQAFDPVWDMVLEGSTGHSGSFGRQVTMNVRNADTYLTHDLLDALETASEDGGVVLLATGMFLENGSGRPVTLRYDPQVRKGAYIDVANDDRAYKRDELAGLARSGEFVGTFTGRHGPQDDYDHPQPGLWTLSSLHAQEGQQEFPILHGDEKTMRLHGRHVRSGAHVHVNGRRVDGEVRFGEDERLDITLETLPPVGLHFLQVQNPGGLFSNDFIFHVAETEEKATALRYANNPDLLRDGLARAIENGRLEEVSNLVDAGAPIDARRRATGMTPLSTAVFQGHFDIARYLIEEKGAAVSRANRDGNTPLHLAAFLCRIELVKLLLEHGASLSVESDRGESPIDVVSSPWNDGLAGFYRSISEGSGLDLDLEELERRRPRLVRLLREAAGGPKNALSLLPRGADGWRFEDSGTAVPESWAARAFDDSEWKRGSAPLGYGEEGLASRVRFGPNPRRKFPAAFFRRTFSVDHPGASETFAGGIRADDGAVIYLNGQEIHRLRMPDGKIDHRTFAADSTESESGLEGRYTLFSIPAKVLKKGGNVISVSVHQRHGASSDLVLDLELLGLSREDLPRYQRSLEE